MAKKSLLTLNLGLIFVLLLTLFVPLNGNDSVSASPDRLEWSVVDTPSQEGYVVISPNEINAIAIGSDGETFYAIDIPNAKAYKSTDAGITWEDNLTDALKDEGAALPAWDIAVAPDDPELVAVVTNSRAAVYVSMDGGESWTDTDVPDLSGLLIADIAISSEYDDGEHDIAIGTRNPDGNTNGDVWVIRQGRWGWDAQELNMDVTSVRFSPGYDDDEAILAIASDTDKTYLCLGYRSISNNITEWEEEPIEIIDLEENDSGDSPNESEIITSDLVLPSADYSNKSWIAYASYYSTTTANTDDVYRIEDSGEVFRLKVKHGTEIGIASIAYNGGKLLVGGVLADDVDSAEALIRICSNPTNYSPKWEKPTNPPTGGAISGCANAQVGWANGVAYCGTSSSNVATASDWADTDVSSGHPWCGTGFDESAFSRSNEGGDTWSQLSLIDTEMANLCDYALSADGKTLYLASRGGDFDSLWRSESEIPGETWQRILCFAQKGEGIILRSALEEGEEEAIFLAIVGTDDVQYSVDKGQSWEQFWDCPEVTDLAVVNNELFYVLDGNLFNKGWWDEEEDRWEWQRDIETGLSSAYMLAISGEDAVFVAEDEDGEGKVAYSSDGGASFEVTESVPEPGNMQIIPDEDFDANKLIYATTDEDKIYRWTIGGSTSWDELNPRHSGFYGLAQKGGALYGTYRSGIDRTLIPHQQTIRGSDWDSLVLGLAAGVTFKLGSLRAISNEAIDLWAMDGRSYNFEDNEGCLWVYSDTFVLRTPWPTSPALGELAPCDVCTCSAEGFCFRWRELSPTEEYEVWIALDEEFMEVLYKEKDIIPSDIHSPAWCLLPDSLRLVCGETYYWKVRSCTTSEGEAIHSPWSPPMHFTVKTCSSEEEIHNAPLLVAPQNDSKDVPRSPGFSWIGFADTTKYEFILAEHANFTKRIVKEEVTTSAYQYNSELNWGTTYFWQVRAIEPSPSEPAVGVFTVRSEPVTPAAKPPEAPVTPLWIWLVIGILSLLIIVVIVLCVVKR